MTTVLLCDDHEMVRAGLAQLLGAFADIEVVGSAPSVDEACRLYEQVHPDVVLMDLAMPVTDGIVGTRLIRRLDPDAKVVLLTAFLERDKVVAALAAGAMGYLLKDASPDELAAGVRAASRGELPLDPKATKVVLAGGASPNVDVVDLSPREREALALVADGHANKVIARRLGISEKTVKAHLTNIFRRLGLENRTQAARWFREQVEPLGTSYEGTP